MVNIILSLILYYSHLVVIGKQIDFDDDGLSVSMRLERFIIETSLIHPDLALKVRYCTGI